MTDAILSSDYTYGDTTITVNDGSLLPSAPNSVYITNGRNSKIAIAYGKLVSNTLSDLTIIDGENTVYPTGCTVVRTYMDYTTIADLSKAMVTGGGGGSTTDYTRLTNKPQINSIELVGNKSLTDLGIQEEIDKKVTKAGTSIFSIGLDLTTGQLYYEG